MASTVGIDLGTTNSVVSIYRRGVAEALPVEGRGILPSAIALHPDGRILVGNAARGRLALSPESCVTSSKRDMGDRTKTYPLGDRGYSPVEIATLILERLRQAASEALGEPVREAVITVPAYFDEAQREDTRRASEAAGLKVLQLLPEPTAAAIAYGLDRGKDQTLLVYDLGGGTFDVSILEVCGNEFRVKAVGGDGCLGGDDFDEAIMRWAEEQFTRETGIELAALEASNQARARQRLREAAETAKLELSQSETALISLPDFAYETPLQLELTLPQYNALVQPLVDRTIRCIHGVLQDSGLSPEEIDRVILVGGSTRNVAVRHAVSQAIKEPYTSDRVDEIVSHGAAIVAADLKLPIPRVVREDRTAHSLGVDVLNEDSQLIFQALIPRQTPYPCRFGRLFSTNRPQQTQVKIAVYRGESIDLRQNARLGELVLPVDPQPCIVPIGTIFELDRNGIIHFTAVQLPLDPCIGPILEHAEANDQAIDLQAFDSLVEQGQAQGKTIQIQS